MSNTRIYVGSLPYSFGDPELAALFAAHGAVRSARVMMDRETGRSRGFGFVEMDTAEQAVAAIAGLDGKDCEGQALRVKEARERPPRPTGGGSDGGGVRPRSHAVGPSPSTGSSIRTGRTNGRGDAWKPREGEREHRGKRNFKEKPRDEEPDRDDFDRDY